MTAGERKRQLKRKLGFVLEKRESGGAPWVEVWPTHVEPATLGGLRMWKLLMRDRRPCP